MGRVFETAALFGTIALLALLPGGGAFLLGLIVGLVLRTAAILTLELSQRFATAA